MHDVAGHGERLEQGRLTASTAPVSSSDWPGLRQTLRLDRQVVKQGTGAVLRAEPTYAVTSLAPDEAIPARRLRRWRQHWHIEDRLHRVRYVTFDENRATVRACRGPQVMAALRNAAIGLMRCAGAGNIAAARPADVLAAVGRLRDSTDTDARPWGPPGQRWRRARGTYRPREAGQRSTAPSSLLSSPLSSMQSAIDEQGSPSPVFR